MSGHTPYDILMTYKPRILVRKIEKKEREKMTSWWCNTIN